MKISISRMFNTIYSLFFLSSFISSGSGVRQCYVCQSENPEDLYQLSKSFPGTSSFPSCSSFRHEQSQNFLRNCPDHQTGGCLTKLQGGVPIMRSCVHVSVEDCQEANGVRYCYCKNEACNMPESNIADLSDNTHVDDEDSDVEGSTEWSVDYYDETGFESSGDGEDDYEDITNPPPYLVQEEVPRDRYQPKHKGRRKQGEDSTSDIIFMNEGSNTLILGNTKRKGSGAMSYKITFWLPIIIIPMFISSISYF